MISSGISGCITHQSVCVRFDALWDEYYITVSAFSRIHSRILANFTTSSLILRILAILSVSSLSLRFSFYATLIRVCITEYVGQDINSYFVKFRSLGHFCNYSVNLGLVLCKAVRAHLSNSIWVFKFIRTLPCFCHRRPS